MKREDLKVGMKLVIDLDNIVTPSQRTREIHNKQGYVTVTQRYAGIGVWVAGDSYIASYELQYCKPYIASYKEGDRFRVVAVNGHNFKLGDTVVLVHNDGTYMPGFRRESDGRSQFVRYTDLEFIEEIKGESKMQSRFKVGDKVMYPYLEVVEMPKPKRTELKKNVKYTVEGREIYWLGVDSNGQYVFGEGLHHTVSDKSHHMDFLNAQIGYLDFLRKEEALELEEA